MSRFRTMTPSLPTRCLALALVLMLGAASGCIVSPDREYGGHGEVLSIGAHKPRILDKVVYTGSDGVNYEITPQEEGAKIAAVRARAVNLESTQVTLSIDAAAVTLNGKEGEAFAPFEPSSRHVETNEEPPEENPYGAHMWGRFQLRKGFELAGWFFFEVPDGLEYSDFAWEDVEFIRVPYPR